MRRGPICLITAALLVAGGIRAQSQNEASAVTADPAAVAANLQLALQQLPEGTGKQLTALACTRCHNLNGLPAYKGYWSREQWLTMVEAMVKHGAELNAAQKQLVTDYLNSSYGRSSDH